MAPIETILEALCAGQMSLPEAAAILAQASRQNPASTSLGLINGIHKLSRKKR